MPLHRAKHPGKERGRSVNKQHRGMKPLMKRGGDLQSFLNDVKQWWDNAVPQLAKYTAPVAQHIIKEVPAMIGLGDPNYVAVAKAAKKVADKNPKMVRSVGDINKAHKYSEEVRDELMNKGIQGEGARRRRKK